MVLTLRGGGPGGPAEMGIAAGGLIKQSIVPDPNPAGIWVRLLDSLSSCSHLTVPRPARPLSRLMVARDCFHSPMLAQTWTH